MKPFLCSCLLFISIASLCAAQNKTETLTNANIVAMVKAGLPSGVIANTVKNSPNKFDLSPNALIALKKQGVGDDVLTAMSAQSSGTAPVAGKVSTDTKIAKLDAGIYYEDGTGKQTPLEPNIFTTAKMGGGVFTAMTYGAVKTKYKAVLQGERSKIQLKETNPVFYLVFNANGETWISGATSPNEFLLVKFKSVKKTREVVTGTLGLSGISTAIDDANKIAFQSAKVSSGVYKITFDKPIPAGEYGFIYAGAKTSATDGSAPSAKTYDFSIIQ